MTSRRTSSRPVGLLLVLGVITQAVAVPSVSCHIHPPGSSPERPRGIIGPFDTIQACERERAARFGAAGRCHCAADFSPRWLAPPEDGLPGQSPLG